MCTLTFVPRNDGSIVLTSNRDEAPGRDTEMPGVFEHSGVKMLYPKDVRAGGSWIGISEHRRIIGLLNGAFRAHTVASGYRKSRGLVVLDLLSCIDLKRELLRYNFDGIEPFTLVVYSWDAEPELIEIIWDGSRTYHNEVAINPSIWSSAMLYDTKARALRQRWFRDFISENPDPAEDSILNFHTTTGTGDPASDLVMDRGFVLTKSITQLTVAEKVDIYYRDLQKDVADRMVFKP